MRNYIICIAVILFSIHVNAQEAEKIGKTISYKGFVELGGGIAYNLNTAQTVSNLNMQMLWHVTTSHGIKYKGLFGGLGLGYNRTQRDKENMYLTYADVRYTFNKCINAPSIGLKGGIIYDPYWIEKVQSYGAITCNLKVYKRFYLGLEGSVFTRPSRHFTANALLVAGYTIGE